MVFKNLIIIGCNQKTITDKTSKNLKGNCVLHMNECHQDTITDKAFEYLKCIHTLDVSDCNQKYYY